MHPNEEDTLPPGCVYDDSCKQLYESIAKQNPFTQPTYRDRLDMNSSRKLQVNQFSNASRSEANNFHPAYRKQPSMNSHSNYSLPSVAEGLPTVSSSAGGEKVSAPQGEKVDKRVVLPQGTQAFPQQVMGSQQGHPRQAGIKPDSLQRSTTSGSFGSLFSSSQDDNKKGNAATDGKYDLAISFSPLGQMHFHSKLEYILQSAANDFLYKRYVDGTLDSKNFARVRKSWKKQGRPTVVEFRFNIATQWKLANANEKALTFPGAGRMTTAQVRSTIKGWSTLARQLSVKTFCEPDILIKMQCAEARRVLILLDASDADMAFFDTAVRDALGEIDAELERQFARETYLKVNNGREFKLNIPDD